MLKRVNEIAGDIRTSGLRMFGWAGLIVGGVLGFDMDRAWAGNDAPENEVVLDDWVTFDEPRDDFEQEYTEGAVTWVYAGMAVLRLGTPHEATGFAHNSADSPNSALLPRRVAACSFGNTTGSAECTTGSIIQLGPDYLASPSNLTDYGLLKLTSELNASTDLGYRAISSASEATIEASTVFLDGSPGLKGHDLDALREQREWSAARHLGGLGRGHVQHHLDVL